MLSPITLTYTVVVPLSVLVGNSVDQILLSVLYCISPPLPPVTPIVCGSPSYVPVYFVNVGFVAGILFTVTKYVNVCVL